MCFHWIFAFAYQNVSRLIALLKEECVRPGGSDKDFVSKTSAMHKDKEFFFREKSYDACQFGIHHYAGRVIYDATQFVTRNMDTLPLDLQNCAKKSKNSIVANELARTGGPLKTGTPTKRPGGAHMKQKDGNSLVGETVSSKFRNQLGALMANLSTTRTRYIRCIKPNQEKKPFLMDHVSTVEQLRCAGVVAAVTISRSAFPNRLDHQGVLDRFRSLWRHVSDDVDVKDTVDKSLTKSLAPLEATKNGDRVKGFVMGKTRAYFRAGSLEYLEKERLKALSVRVTEIQRVARKYLAYSCFKRWKCNAIRIQSAIRMSLVRSSFKTKRSAAICLQSWSRCLAAARQIVVLRRYYRAVRIQSHWRRIITLTRFLAWRSAAVIIQKIARGALQRPKYRVALFEKREEAKLENQVRALQRKLEEAEKRRLEAEKKAEASVVAASAAAIQEEKKEVDSPASSMTGQDDNGMSNQHTLMDESGKMLEYLRKEVFKLRSHNARLRRDYDLLKGNNQRLMDANASAGASFAALNQHAKQLQKTKDKIEVEYDASKAQVQKLSITQVELREELKMKQATYIAEVHSRLQYQRALSRIIDVSQSKGGDSRLVDEILRIADACEAEYMNGPTGIAPPQLSLFGTPNSPGPRSVVYHDSGIISSIRKIWS
jgi:myosin V